MTARATVLLVEPDAHFASVLEAALEQAGWSVRHTPSGRRALAIYANERPDVVVTEVELDDLDGFELLESLRSFGPSPPVVVCTRLAGAYAWDPQALSAIGVRSSVVRPTRLEHITRAVAGCIAADLTEQAVYLPPDDSEGLEGVDARHSRESMHGEMVERDSVESHARRQ